VSDVTNPTETALDEAAATLLAAGWIFVPPESLKGRWHVMQTLIGSLDGVDINRRTLMCGSDRVATFNSHFGAWQDDKALHDICRYLNARDAGRDSGHE
jgi:hypothetical protein